MRTRSVTSGKGQSALASKTSAESAEQATNEPRGGRTHLAALRGRWPADRVGPGLVALGYGRGVGLSLSVCIRRCWRSSCRPGSVHRLSASIGSPVRSQEFPTGCRAGWCDTPCRRGRPPRGEVRSRWGRIVKGAHQLPEVTGAAGGVVDAYDESLEVGRGVRGHPDA